MAVIGPKDSVVQIVEQAMEGNTIVVIPKGFHRIFVASMLIKKKYRSNCQPLNSLKHKVVCLVGDNSKMIYWDSELKKNIPFSVINSDKCILDRQNIFQHDVILMTPDVFSTLLNCGHLTFENICLLIIDECQNAVTNPSLMMISKIYRQLSKKPLVIGFTTTIISPESTLESLASDIEKLKDTFYFSISTLNSTTNLSMRTDNPCEFVQYSLQTEEEENWAPVIEKHFENSYILDLILYSEHDKPSNIIFKNSLYSDSWNDLMKAMECFVTEVCNTLGLYAAEKAVLLVLLLIKKNLLSISDESLSIVINGILSSLVLLQKKMLYALQKCSSDEQYPFNQCSAKLKAFLFAIRQFRQNEYNLILVEHPETAMVLCYVLKDLRKTDDSFKHVEPDYLINADFHSTKTKEMNQFDNYNAEALKSFLLHESNVLFSLYQIEELDGVPNNCNTVLLFDIPTSFTYYYKAIEKALHPMSKLIIFYKEEDKIEFFKVYDYYYKMETSLLSSIACKSKREGERAVAAEDSEELNRMEKLDMHFLPQGSNSCCLDTEEYFPQQINEPAIIAGKKCNIRDYKKTIPEWLVESNPDVRKHFYIHIVKIAPDFVSHSNIDQVYFDFLTSSQTISFTSSKKWPEISNFYLYIKNKRFEISVITNFKKIEFTKEEVEAIVNYQTFLFTELIPIVKSFMIHNESNLTFVIPTILSDTDTTLSVDWEAIRCAAFPKIFENSIQEANEIKHAPINFYGKVIIPHHNKLNESFKIECCLINSVNIDKTPNTEMNRNLGNSYTNYFSDRYKAVIEIEDQPLIEVLTLPAYHHVSLNMFKTTIRQRTNRPALFAMTLVPELCTFIDFPAVYILKSSFIPCILHRTYQLMVCETIRLKIFNHVGLGKQECSIGSHCVQPIKTIPNSNLLEGVEITNLLIISMKSLLSQSSTWTTDDVPRDIFRDLLDTNFIDVVHFRHFVELENQERLENIKPNSSINSKIAGVEKLSSECRTLTLLSMNNLENSPNLWDILKAITCQSANDLTSLNKIKNLGYSFLNFVSSLALYKMHPNLGIAKLREIRNKVVGRTNIFYCGINIELGSMMQINEFDLLDCYIPSYTVDSILNCLYQDNVIPIKLITDLELDATERDSGIYSAETIAKIDQAINDHSSNVIEKAFFPSLFGVNSISDNEISKCTAALIAIYLESCGILGAIKLCNWLGIVIPESVLSPTPCGDISNNTVLKHSKVEDAINYALCNEDFIKQALKYSFREDSPCNQSLMFLGEAIIDFLLTTFIHEHFQDLSNDDAISLHHALNNDVVFACLSVRYNFHKHINFTSFELARVTNRFVTFQEHCNHEIGTETLLLVYECDVGIEEDFDVPQVLSDIFKCLIGTVFLTYQNLNITWNILHSLMNQEIARFSENIPKDFMFILQNKFCDSGFAFSKITNVVNNGIPRTLIFLQLQLPDEPLVFSGYGEDKQRAKMAAAKMALRYWGTKFLFRRKKKNH